MYFDTMVFGEVASGYLVCLYGSDHVLFGTDSPYDIGETDAIGLIEKVEGLAEGDVASIVGENAARLPGLAREKNHTG